MKKILPSLNFLGLLYISALMSCMNIFVDTKNVFEKASKNDSLSYYFPSILSDSIKTNDMYTDFEQRWYSSSLYSFKEPILYTKNDSLTIYRLLWLRSFNKPVCFSIKEFKGNYFLNAKTLDREPSFLPNIESKGKDKKTGKYIYDTTKKADRFALIDYNTINVLRSGQWDEVEDYISKLNFWNSPVADPANDGSSDGSNWILEGYKNGKYHFINRRNARGDLREFGKFLIKRSGLNIDDKSFY